MFTSAEGNKEIGLLSNNQLFSFIVVITLHIFCVTSSDFSIIKSNNSIFEISPEVNQQNILQSNKIFLNKHT